MRSYFRRQGENGLTVKEPAPASAFADHLSAHASLGLVPINGQNQCSWAALDLDLKPDKDGNVWETFAHADLARICANTPLIVTRSKSGGAHVYVFFQTPQPARAVRKKLAALARDLSWPHTEIFPKQEKLSETNFGNALGLPYFAGDRSNLYALRADGTSLPLAEFVETVARVRVAGLMALEGVHLGALPRQGQSATQAAERGEKIQEGAREAMLIKRVSKLSKLRVLPQGVWADVQAYNAQFCDPPMTVRELEAEIFPAIQRFAEPVARPDVELPAARAMGVVEFLSQPTPVEPDWLVKDLIIHKTYSLWYGFNKAGKSHALQQLAFDAARGAKVFEYFDVPRPARVMYVELVQSEFFTMSRHHNFERAWPHETRHQENLFYLTREMFWAKGRRPHDLADLGSAQGTQFLKQVQDLRIDLVILAEIRSLVDPGSSLNEMEVGEKFNAWAQEFQASTRAALAAISHARKELGNLSAQSLSGHGMLGAEPDLLVAMRELPTELRQVNVFGRFDVPEFSLEKVRLNGGEIIRFAKAPERLLTERVRKLRALGRKVREIAEETRENQATIKRVISRIIKEDKARKKAAEPEFSYEGGM